MQIVGIVGTGMTLCSRGVATPAIKNKVLKRVKDNNYTPDGGQESLR